MMMCILLMERFFDHFFSEVVQVLENFKALKALFEEIGWKKKR